MVQSTQTGMAQTVLGPIRPEKLGVTLAHEHLLIDLRFMHRVPAEAHARGVYYRPVSLETLGYLTHYSMASLDNLTLLDVDVAVEEVKLFKQHGGQSVVDATSIGIGRDPVSLARIARETGLNIVMGSSYYVDGSHPPDMDERSEDGIAEQIVRDITEGVDGTGIRAGIIGEVGCSWPLTANERKVLRASARAQRRTGAPILIHPGRDERAPMEIIDVLRGAGADIGRTVVGHLERTMFDRGPLRELADSGCFLEWDHFGLELSYFANNPKVELPNDAQRMDFIAWAMSEGYGDRIVVSHDVSGKRSLLRYGGRGYFYIQAAIVPRMRARGFTEQAIRSVLVDNPASVLSFASPQGEE
jgi:phosphotriesterase-related protein